MALALNPVPMSALRVKNDVPATQPTKPAPKTRWDVTFGAPLKAVQPGTSAPTAAA